MWLYGFGWLGLDFLIRLIPIDGTYFLRFIIMVLVSIKFKEIYLKYVAKEVQTIRKNNSGKTKEQLLDICKNRGGVYPGVIIFAVLYVVLVLALFLNQLMLAS